MLHAQFHAYHVPPPHSRCASDVLGNAAATFRFPFQGRRRCIRNQTQMRTLQNEYLPHKRTPDSLSAGAMWCSICHGNSRDLSASATTRLAPCASCTLFQPGKCAFYSILAPNPAILGIDASVSMHNTSAARFLKPKP